MRLGRNREMPPEDGAGAPSWRRYLRFWRANVEEDVDAELAFHLDMRTRDLVARGMSESDARAEASAHVENIRLARAACVTIGYRRQRRAARSRTIDSLGQDIRYALRTLRRQKAWTTIAVLTLALGIGATTAMFSVVNSLVLHPLPYRDADRVVTVWSTPPKSPDFMIAPEPRFFARWQMAAHGLEAMEEYDFATATLTGRGDAAALRGFAISPGFMDFVGSRPLLGRGFTPSDTLPGSTRVAIIGEPMWRSRFGASSSIVGEPLVLDDRTYRIVGVAPMSLRAPSAPAMRPDFWLPLGRDTLTYSHWIVARLRRGVDMAAAARELDAIAARLSPGKRDFVTRVAPPPQVIGYKGTLALLASAAALLLIVSCTNVAHLLVARGATRRRELAIRTALGAGRRRLLRQLLTESLILGGIGSVFGLAIGYAGVRVLVALRPQSLDELSLAHIDRRALLAALVVSIVTGIAFGLTAALHAVRRSASEALRGNVLSGTTTRPRNRLRSGLVVTEMALSTLLLVGAALLVRSVVNLEQVDPGFNASNLYLLPLHLPPSRYTTDADRMQTINAALARARSIPGVTGATKAAELPPASMYQLFPIEAEGAPVDRGPMQMARNDVDPNYFSVLGIRLLAGATFTQGAATRHEVIINDGLAHRLWPDGPAVGRRIRFIHASDTTPPEWLRVVGVADNIPIQSLKNDRTAPMVYFPNDEEHAGYGASIGVRTLLGIDPTAAWREIVRALDPKLALPRVRTVSSALEETIATQRFTMVLLAAFASLALLLSAIGLYGVISFVVTQRTREIGIRVALGATAGHVARAVVARGFLLSVEGIAIGLIAAVWGARLLSSALYGVSVVDPLSYGVTAAVLLVISLAACLVPMRRAVGIDPAITMRAE
ncbi:MAG TPA: ABC transporter permease [Gemmatimonadaceae bacterium]|nr:ABC transporter permease [Gemmatimonadaceae bacterium]